MMLFAPNALGRAPATLFEKATVAGIFSLPVLMGTVSGAASSIFVVMLVLSLFYAWGEWKHLTAVEKSLCLAMVGFFAAALLSFINSDDIAKSWARLERLLRALAFIPLYLFFRRLRLDYLTPLTRGAVVAGPLLLGLAFFTMVGERASGAYNVILFGDYAAYVTVLLLGYLALQPKGVSWPLIALLSLGCATYAMVLSGTRGAWVAPPLAVAVLVVHLLTAKSSNTSTRRSAVIVALLTVVGVGLLSQHPQIQTRLASAVAEFQGYWTGSNPHTSLGFRFQMWEAAVKMWQQHPIIGTGLGDYSRELAQMMASGESKMTEHFGEAHNLYFEFLGTTGLLGLATCLAALFVLPGFIFLRASFRQDDSRIVAVTGLLLVLSFAVFGLTQNWLGRSSITSVYLMLLAVLLAQLNITASRRPGR